MRKRLAARPAQYREYKREALTSPVAGPTLKPDGRTRIEKQLKRQRIDETAEYREVLKEAASKLIAPDNKIESPLRGTSIGCPIVIGVTPVQRISVGRPSNATILRRPTKGQTVARLRRRASNS